jgi:SAM-dependent methyltransferase
VESVACDLCGGTDQEIVVSQTDIYHGVTSEFFNVVRCVHCGLHFLNPRPAEDEISIYYSRQYDFHRRRSRLELFALGLLQKLANSRLHNILNLVPLLNKKLVTYIKPPVADPVIDIIAKSPNKVALLDIGCGAGITAHLWGSKGALSHYKRIANVFGVEVSETARKVLERNGVIAYDSIHAVAGEMRFDIIRMNWSLEHVHRPSEYFEFIARSLTGDGRAIIAVPNFEGLLYRIAIDSVEVPLHLYHFRREDIENYSRRFGLKVLSAVTFSYPQMYRFLSERNQRLGGVFSDMSLLEAYYFQRTLCRFDSLGTGNDMIFVLSRA